MAPNFPAAVGVVFAGVGESVLFAGTTVMSSPGDPFPVHQLTVVAFIQLRWWCGLFSVVWVVLMVADGEVVELLRDVVAISGRGGVVRGTLVNCLELREVLAIAQVLRVAPATGLQLVFLFNTFTSARIFLVYRHTPRNCWQHFTCADP